MRILYIILLSILFISCNEKISNTNLHSRIKKIQDITIDAKGYYIIQVDNHQYFTNGSSGGIIHLESCLHNYN
jgi:S-adenosylmethionine/arginine decarboxylase-like enzyme